MLRSKNIDRICCLVIACTMLLAAGFTALAGAGVLESSRKTSLTYAKHLFDQSTVHKIEITMDGWDDFIDNCTDEKYRACAVTIDGEAQGTVGIRAKGNTSLSSMAQYDNDRYSFKIEFDHYQKKKTYRGLDKLSLNNIIQDATYMKDYWSYTFMNQMGLASPLCSYTEIYVNGEYWGLYLAVEGVEEAFLERNYGEDYGELYKPDSLSFGGGRGNGQAFDMQDFEKKLQGDDTEEQAAADENAANDNAAPTMPQDIQRATRINRGDFKQGGGMGGMGSSDVKLQYIDDDPDSYANIFDNAKTKVKKKDQARLIAALKKLSEGDTSAVDTDAVAMYMAVHNFLCNGDSYTGSMVHNYYLYEKDGVMSMIPWDYNLAFGGFTGGSDATGTVNTAIDTLVSGGDDSDRPMAGWITASDESLALYHEKYQQFIDTVFTSGWFESEFDRVSAMIAPYVEKETRAFYSYEEFQTAADTLKTFCIKRAQSVQGQLDGSISATGAAQQGSDALIDASELSITAMGGMNNGKGGDRGGNAGFPGSFGGDFSFDAGSFTPGDMPQPPTQGENGAPPDMPDGGFDGSFGGFGRNASPQGAPSNGEKPQEGSAQPDLQQTQAANPAPQDAAKRGAEENMVAPMDQTQPDQTRTQLLWLLVSVGTLIAACIVGKRFRHRV